MTPRVTSEFWLSAYRKRLEISDIPAFVTAKGDKTAGAILVKLNTLDGNAKLFQRAYNLDGDRVWTVLAEGAEREVDEASAQQRRFDPDLWVIEVEDKSGRHLLDEEGLSS